MRLMPPPIGTCTPTLQPTSCACLPRVNHQLHLPGVDPKSIVCEYFRHGQCTKGFKCKFSHDLSVERKTHKADVFTDRWGRVQTMVLHACCCMMPSCHHVAAVGEPRRVCTAPLGN